MFDVLNFKGEVYVYSGYRQKLSSKGARISCGIKGDIRNAQGTFLYMISIEGAKPNSLPSGGGICNSYHMRDDGGGGEGGVISHQTINYSCSFPIYVYEEWRFV